MALTTITSAGIAADAVTSAKIADGAITNADVNNTAAIAQSKLALDIVNANVNASAAIAQSKLAAIAADALSGNVIDGGTISNFASTGIDDNADALAVTITSAEKVGLGVTAPDEVLEVNGAIHSGNRIDIYKGGNVTKSGTMGANDDIGLTGLNASDFVIKTTEATSAFGIATSGASDVDFCIADTGSVGINTVAPDKMLHLVGGDLKLEGTSSQKELIFKNTSATAPHGKISYLGSAGTQYWNIGSNVRAGPGWEINEGAGQGTCRFNVAVGGNVGIGTDTTAPAKQFEITKSAVARFHDLVDAATIAVDFNTGQNFAVTLGANRALGNPTNVTAGQTGSIFVTQDGTGGRTLSYGSNWKFPAGTAPTLTTTANAVDRIDYIVRGATLIQAVATLAYA